MMLTHMYLQYAHGPAAEDGHEPAQELVAMKRGVMLEDLTPSQLKEVKDVAELWHMGGDAEPWVVSRTRKILKEIAALPR